MKRGDRLHNILRLFSPERPLWTAEDTAAALNVSLSTAYRQLGALVKSGLLEAVEASRAYVLGPAIIELDRSIRLSDPLITVAKPAMRWLAEQAPVSCTILLCRLYRDRVMCVQQEEKPGEVGAVSYERGRPMPLSRGAPSRTILAQLPPRRLNAMLATIAAENAEGFDSDAFRGRLRDIRRQGYCITRGEVDPGVIGIAVPLATPRRGMIASLGIACFGMPDEVTLARVRALLTATAETIKASLSPGV
jgi:DNA-binding IclR family transcriptional regulator